MNSDSAQRFEAQIRSLVSEDTGGGETTPDVSRRQVEELGMSLREACTQFFALRGSVWDVVDLHSSTIHSDESSALPPPRNWFGINDIYLV